MGGDVFDQLYAGEIMTENIDVDATWDGKGSLDDHRTAAFEKIKQAGFGIHSDKMKARAQKPAEPVVPQIDEVDDGE